MAVINQATKKVILTSENTDLSFIPKIYATSESDMLTDYESTHCKIKRSELSKSSYLATRIAIHEFAYFMLKNGQDFRYNDLDIDTEFKKFCDFDLNNVFKNGAICTRKFYSSIGFKIIKHYFPNKKKRIYYWVKIIEKQIELMLKSRNRTSVTTSRIIGIYQLKEWTALGYAAVIDRCCPFDTILDLNPSSGLKALACARLRKKYIAVYDHRLDTAVQRGFCDRIGLDFEFLTPESKFDTIICDNGLRRFDIQPAKEYLDRAKSVIAYVDFENIKFIKSQKPAPTKIIPMKKFVNTNYLVVW